MSLVELMVALVIGSILMLGVVQIFGASRTAYQLSEGMARTQENARFAIDYLQRDLRMAGHWGCVNDQSHLQSAGAMASHFPSGNDPLNFAVSIQAYEATGTAPGDAVTLGAAASGWSPALPGTISGLNPLPGSDILVLRYLSNQGAPVNAITMSGSSTSFTVPVERWSALTGDGVSAPRLFGIADCSFVDIFPASAVSAGAGMVTTGSAIDRYTAQPSGQTVLYRADSVVYYIGAGASGEPALRRARHDGTAYVSEELVEGVESMQLVFGRDRVTDLTTKPPSGYIDDYGTAEDIGANADQWRRVGSVQVGLVMRSPEPAAAPQPTEEGLRVRALGVRFDPSANGDGRVRASYETTVALRNRLYGN
ncbi:PilW family protein [[Pseudomonas] boreopolis]